MAKSPKGATVKTDNIQSIAYKIGKIFVDYTKEDKKHGWQITAGDFLAHTDIANFVPDIFTYLIVNLTIENRPYVAGFLFCV